MPATLNIAVRQGSTYRQPFQFKDGAGVAMNLTGYTLRAQARAGWGGSLMADFLVNRIDLATGQFELYLSDTTTGALSAGNGVWDFELVAPGTGDVSCPLSGTFVVTPGATR